MHDIFYGIFLICVCVVWLSFSLYLKQFAVDDALKYLYRALLFLVCKVFQAYAGLYHENTMTLCTMTLYHTTAWDQYL